MAIYKINESKKVNESYEDGKISINQIREAISDLEELVSEMEINNIESVNASPNTYGLGSFFLGTSSGYINLNDVYSYLPDGEDEDEDGEYESLTEATDPQDYRVVTVAMDVAMPADKRLEDYGVGGGGNNKLFSAISKTLNSEGLEMAGDYIDSVGEVTQVYKDNEYEFSFNQE